MFRFRWGTMRRSWVLWLGLSAQLWAIGGPVPFVPTVQGDLSPSGLPGFFSSPARTSAPGFAIAAVHDAENVEEFVYAGYGEVGIGPLRLAFFSSFHGLDSLYRQSYSELQSSLPVESFMGSFVLGAAYGLSMEWLPGAEKWVRHRYKGGALFLWRDFAVGGTVYGFSDDMDGYVAGRGGLHWEPQGSFSFFLEADRSSVWLGNGIRFRYGDMHFRYEFPDFSVSLLFSACWEGWFAGMAAGSGNVPILGAFSGKRLAK